MSVTQDATFGYYIPQSASEWTSLLSGDGISNPSSLYKCQEASGSSLADSIGSRTWIKNGSPTYQNAVSGWSNKAIKPSGTANYFGDTTSGVDPNSSSFLMLWIMSFGTVDVNTRTLAYFGGGGTQCELNYHNGHLVPKLGANSAEGAIDTSSAVKVIVFKVDRSRSTATAYMDGAENITPTWANPTSGTDFFWGGVDSAYPSSNPGALYAAYWTGSAAEMSDSQVSTLITRIKTGPAVVSVPGVPWVTPKPASRFNVIAKAGQQVKTTVMIGTQASTITTPTTVSGTTLAAMQAGSMAYKYVLAIEGYSYLLSDASSSAVLAAWSGTDWQNVLGGLYVQLDNQQRAHPWEPFQGGGRMTFRVQPDSTDQFGIDTHRKASGAEALLTCQINRNGISSQKKTKFGPVELTWPYIQVDNGGNSFTAGDVFCGTECMSIQGGGQTIGVNQRGKYSPFGNGNTGRWFAQHHRVPVDSQGVLIQPVVSAQPRVWVGKWVGLWMHKVDGSGNLNSKANAQLVFAGKIVAISDDPSTGYTVVECKHALDAVKDAAVGADLWTAQVPEGVYIATGGTFSFSDTNVTTTKTANTLTVVASGASGANQINAGFYSLEEVVNFLNNWLSSELTAGRILGSYVWKSPFQTSDGLRTICQWTITAGTAGNPCGWSLSLSNDVYLFLGFGADAVQGIGFANQRTIAALGSVGTTPSPKQSDKVPYRSLFGKFTGNASNQNYQIEIQNERGLVLDQYALLPAAVKQATSGGNTWGIFLLDEKYLVTGTYTQGVPSTLNNVALLPPTLNLPGADQTAGGLLIGRRADAQQQFAPMALRQIIWLEGTFSSILKTLFYSTGTNAYNHATYDTLGYGLGIGIPGALLGSSFETSIDQLPGSGLPISVVIDQSVKFSQLLGADLVLRRAFPVWKNGGLRFTAWQSPNTDLSVAAFAESNKAEPSGNQAEHRTANVETDQWMQNAIKISYDRDFTFGKGGNYTKSLTFEDRVSVDENGERKPFTIEARNTYSQFAQAGLGIEALAPHFLALMPFFSRPLRMLTRSIDLRYFEGLAPGDIVTVTDAFARDPASGTRGITARSAVILRHRYNPGGPTPGNPANVTPPAGEVDLLFLDLHRWCQYAPSMKIDNTYALYGFSAGYSVGQKQIVVLRHEYSDPLENNDSAPFSVGDAILITEIDPSTPSAALSWRRKITAIATGATPSAASSSNGYSFTSGTANPQYGGVYTLPTPTFITIDYALTSFDSTKTYRVTYDHYSTCQPAQQAKAFEAPSATARIESVAAPFQLSATEETISYTATSGKAENLPTVAYGDGAAHDVGHERALIRTLNNLNDYKTAHNGVSAFSNECVSITGQSNFVIVSIGPIFLGSDMLSSQVNRTLSLRPIFRAEGSFTLRATLSKGFPLMAAGTSLADTTVQIDFPDLIAQTTWTRSAAGASGVVELGELGYLFIGAVKNTDGMAWLVVEAKGSGRFFGFGECLESQRGTIAALAALGFVQS